MIQKYRLVMAEDVFDKGDTHIYKLPYGIEWLDDDGTIMDCEWFPTEAKRLRAIDGEKMIIKELLLQIHKKQLDYPDLLDWNIVLSSDSDGDNFNNLDELIYDNKTLTIKLKGIREHNKITSDCKI